LQRRAPGGARLVLHEPRQPRQRERRPVRARHKQALQHHLVELALCAPHQEAVQLRTHTGTWESARCAWRQRDTTQVGATLAAATQQPHVQSQCFSNDMQHSSRRLEWQQALPVRRVRLLPPHAALGALLSTPHHRLAALHAGRQHRTFTRRFRYTFSLFGAVRWTFLLRPPASKSMPCAHACQHSAHTRNSVMHGAGSGCSRGV